MPSGIYVTDLQRGVLRRTKPHAFFRRYKSETCSGLETDGRLANAIAA